MVTKQGPGTEGTTGADVDFMEGAGNWKSGCSRFQHLSKGVQCKEQLIYLANGKGPELEDHTNTALYIQLFI